MALKLFVLGLDGATFDLIKPWAKKGHLPYFSKILKNSYHGNLRSLPPITPAAWTSISTGVNCGKHGLADFLKIDRSTYQIKPTSSKDRRTETVYNILGNEGKKVIILNYPMTYPSEKVNGIMVTGMQTPKHDDRCTYPFGILRDLESKLGEVQFMTHFKEGQTPMEFLESIKLLTKKRSEMIQYFLREHDFDLMMAVFMGLDIVSHSFWKYMDKDHPAHNDIGKKDIESFGSAIKELYVQIDHHLGKILAALKKLDCMFMLVSDHGSGPLHSYLNLNLLIQKWDYLHINENDISITDKKIKSKRNKPLSTQSCSSNNNNNNNNDNNNKNFLFRAISRIAKLHTRLHRGDNQRNGSENHNGLQDYFQHVDWESTKAYSWGNLSSITLNIQGRELKGNLSPENIPFVREQIQKKLLELEDDEGRTLIDEVRFSDEVFHGPYLDELPDIYIISRDLTCLPRGVNPVYKDFMSRKLLEPADISGTHRINGIYAISDICSSNKMIKSMNSIELTGKNYNVMDVAPTILDLFGYPVPSYLDGKVMKEAFL